MSAETFRRFIRPIVAAPRPGRPVFTWRPHQPFRSTGPKDKFPVPHTFTPKQTATPQEQWYDYGRYLGANTKKYGKLRVNNEKELTKARAEVAQIQSNIQRIDERIAEIRATDPRTTRGDITKKGLESINREKEARVKVATELEDSQAYVDYVRDEWVARARAAEIQSGELEDAFLNSVGPDDYRQRLDQLNVVRETPEYIQQIVGQIQSHLDEVFSVPLPEPRVRVSPTPKPAAPKKAATSTTPKKRVTTKKVKPAATEEMQPTKEAVALVVPKAQGEPEIYVKDQNGDMSQMIFSGEDSSAPAAVPEPVPPAAVVEQVPMDDSAPGGWANSLSGLFGPETPEAPVAVVPTPVAPAKAKPTPKSESAVAINVPATADPVVPPPHIQEGLEGLFGPASDNPDVPGVYVVEPAVVTPETAVQPAVPAPTAARAKPKSSSAKPTPKPKAPAPKKEPAKAEKPKTPAKPKPKSNALTSQDLSDSERIAILEGRIAEATSTGQTARARALKGQLTRLRNKQSSGSDNLPAVVPDSDIVMFPPDADTPVATDVIPVPVPDGDNLPVIYRVPTTPESVPIEIGGEVVDQFSGTPSPPTPPPPPAGRGVITVLPTGEVVLRQPSDTAIYRRPSSDVEEIIYSGEELPPLITRVPSEPDLDIVDADWWNPPSADLLPSIDRVGPVISVPANVDSAARVPVQPQEPVVVAPATPIGPSNAQPGPRMWAPPAQAVPPSASPGVSSPASPSAVITRKRRIWPWALATGAIGLGAGYALGLAQGDDGDSLNPAIPTEDEDYRWSSYPHYGTDDQGNIVYYPGVAAHRMTDGTVAADVKLTTARNRLTELGYNPDDPLDVQRFQYSAGIQQDGVIGEQTAAALRSVQRQIGRRGYDIWTDANLPGPQNVPSY